MSVVRTLRLHTLLRHPGLQVRASMDENTVNRYATAIKNEASFPPIKVALVEGVSMVVDGWHRIAALEKLNRAEVEAEVVEGVSMAEAAWMAASANLSHGLPLKGRELRKVFRAYVKARRYRAEGGGLKSYRDIARDLGGLVSYTTVRNWMARDFPKVFQRMGGGEPTSGGDGVPKVSAEEQFAAEAHEALRRVTLASRGITSADSRGALVQHLEDVLTQVRAGGPSERPDF